MVLVLAREVRSVPVDDPGVITVVSLLAALALGWWAGVRRTQSRNEHRTALLVDILGDAMGLVGDEDAADAVVRRLAKVLKADAAAVGVVSGDGLQLLGMHGIDKGMRHHRLGRGEGCSGRAWELGRTLVVPNVSREAGYVEGAVGIRSGAYVLGRVDGRVVLVMSIESLQARRYRDGDMQIVQPVADLLAHMLESRRILRAAEQLEQQLLTLVSHEMRTPLTTILGAISTLDSRWEQLDDSSRHELIASSRRGALRLERLVENAIMAARLEAGDVDFRSATVAVSTVLDEAVRRAADPGRVHTTDASGLVVVADAEHLQAALQALVNNALLHGGMGPVHLDAQGREGAVEISVHDNGPGVAAADRTMMFERFHRGAGQTAPGPGLGLYVARCLVEGMHGELTIARTESPGATFVLRLPASTNSQLPHPRPSTSNQVKQIVPRRTGGDGS